jgi:sugar-specific transcriptional regulator TrmB
LAEWNLVDIDDTTPQEFSPVDSDEAAERLLEEYQNRIETLRAALSALGDGRPRSEN